MSVKPITPKEAKEKFITTIPDAVIEVINTMLAEHGTKREISLKQKDIISRYVSTGINGGHFDTRWLDFEDVYRKAGWIVTYDKPGWDESYDSKYIFKPKPRQDNDDFQY